MRMNEDDEQAVEIAISQSELSKTDMIDIIMDSTGKSSAIAQQQDEPIQSIKEKIISVLIVGSFFWLIGSGLIFLTQRGSIDLLSKWSLMWGIPVSSLVLFAVISEQAKDSLPKAKEES